MLATHANPPKLSRFALVFAAALVLWGGCFLFRGFYANRETSRIAAAEKLESIPFTIEEGVIYGCIRRLADGSPLPPENGWTADEAMSLTMERTLAGALKLRRLFIQPDRSCNGGDPGENAFLRNALLAWISLLPVLIFALLLVLGAPIGVAFPAALIYCVSAAAMARYTGENLLKGNFAMPFIVAGMLCYYAYFRRPAFAVLALLFSCVCAAFFSWDAAQLFFGLFAFAEVVRLLAGGASEPTRARLFATIFFAGVVSSLFSPYCRAHLTIVSPAVLVLPTTAFLLNLLPVGRVRRHLVFALTVAAGLVALSLAGYRDNYDHFFSLFAAKLRFCNIKPADPSLLSFDQRYLWTPALNSLTAAEFQMLYHLTVPLCAVALGVALAFRRFRAGLRRYELVFLLVVYLFLAILFYRFSEFASIFITVVLGMSAAAIHRGCARPGGLVVTAALFLAAWLEAAHTLALVRRPPPGLRGIAELTGCLRRFDLSGQTVLANMDVGGAIFAYTDASIFIQPKFELKPFRDRTESYTRLLFDPDPVKLVDWCIENRIRFFVYSRGSSDFDPARPAAPPHVYSARYMAGAVKPPPSCPALLADYAPERIPGLLLLDTPPELAGLAAGFRIYRVITPDDQFLSEFKLDAARDALASGDRLSAGRLITEAFYLSPSQSAYSAYCRFFATYPAPPALEHYLPPSPP